MWPVRGKDEPTLDPVGTTTIDGITPSVLVVVDEPVPDEGDAGRSQECADDLGPDVAGHLRPWETATPGEGQRDRESPEESRGEQSGQEAVLATGYRIGDEAVAQEDEDEDAEHLPQVLFSPAFFGYRHYFLLLICDQMSRDDAFTMVPTSAPLHLLWRTYPRKKVLTCTLQSERIGQDFSLHVPPVAAGLFIAHE